MAMMQTAKGSGILIAFPVVLSLSAGCFWVTTKHEGQKLRQDVAGLEQRVQTKESDFESKITRLEEVLEEATKVLRRNSADLGADFETIKDQVRVIEGLITAAKKYTDDVRKEVAALQKSVDNDREVLAKRLASMEQRLADLEKRANTPPPKPKTPGEIYAEGKAAFDGRDYATARKAFKLMVVRYPGHDRADDSQYYRGEAYFREKNYDSAIREFQQVFDKFATSALADDALFRAGEAAQRLRRCTEARAYFGLLRQKYPDSSLAKKAKAKDREIKRNAKNKRKCLS